MSKKYTWVIGIGGTEVDGVDMEIFTGTTAEVKKKLIELVNDEKNEKSEVYDYGTESVKEIEKRQWGRSYYAFNCFMDHHTDYEATEINELSRAG